MPVPIGKLSEVGVVYPGSRVHLMRSNYLNQILSGGILACDGPQIDLQIVALRSAATSRSVPVSARDIALRVDGVILLGVVNEAYIAAFAEESVPLVLVDAQSRSAIPGVHIDDVSAVDQLMDHLHALGHRRIGYVDAYAKDDLAAPGEPEWVESVDAHQRREAYLAALDRLGLDYRRIYSPAEPQTLAAGLQRDRQRPSAILVHSASVAAQLCHLLPSIGLKVPQDISLAGPVSSEGGNVIGSHVVTSTIPNFHEMGWCAVEALLEQAAGLSGRVRCVATTLQVGTSTAKPAKR